METMTHYMELLATNHVAMIFGMLNPMRLMPGM